MNFTVQRLRTIDDVLIHWGLFREGLEHMNSLVKPEKVVSPEQFFRIVINTLARGEKKGHVAVYHVEGTSSPIGFTVAHAFEDLFYDVPIAVVHAAYTKRTVPGASRFGLKHIEKWAKANGYSELQAYTPRINGKGFALFERRFGFKRHLVCFFKRL